MKTDTFFHAYQTADDGKQMQITRTSILSGKTRTLELDITDEEIMEFTKGTKAQHAFPRLNVHKREFYKTGIWGREWDVLSECNDDDDTDVLIAQGMIVVEVRCPHCQEMYDGNNNTCCTYCGTAAPNEVIDSAKTTGGLHHD